MKTSGLAAVILFVALALTVPTKDDHEREIRPAAKKWVSTLKSKDWGEVFAHALLTWGTYSMADDPNASIIDTCSWQFYKLLIFSVVIDPDREVKFVSVGALKQVYVNPAKFTNE
ncbi:MAG TPA: hypothetical protein VGW39_00085 [Chthoniobacterales bacterium]|nr:hypothetical protein [Chthoniobacterales bacterium]